MNSSDKNIIKIGFFYKFAVLILRFIAKTWRYKIIGAVPDKPAIVAFWHGLMLPVWYMFSESNPVGVVSLSKDGSVLSYLLSKWNFHLIRGSSSKGGKEVLSEIIESAKDSLILMTPDGPRGPVNKFKAGAVVASQRSGTPLVLCKARVKNKIIFKKSWDKFELPLPFAVIEINLSEKIFVNPDFDKDKIDEIILDCENKLNADSLLK
jgi:lysophospholipid acyltransferase (LPLAT)-like uncharacterized protein